ncbi:MAG: zinc-binding dehydrogenase [Chloroflexota bacterium]
MRGVVFLGNRRAELRQFPDPHAGPGEAVVKVRASGICGSDLHRYRAAAPSETITGHEPCGVVAELGAGAPPGVSIGDRVMVHHYGGCGVCEMCSLGYEQLCQVRPGVIYGGGVGPTAGHGASADYILVPSRTLVPLPDGLSFEEGAAIACGTGTAWNGLKKMNVSGLDTVVVFGQGPVGLSATQAAKAMGARVIAVDVTPERLTLAKELGADHVINGGDEDPIKAIRSLTGGRGAAAAMETSGNPTARAQVLESVRPFGRACYVGLGSPSTATVDIGRDIIMKVLTVYGSWTFSKAELQECARFFVEAKIPLRRQFTHHFSLDQAIEAYRTFDGGATGKCVIVLD